VNFSGFPKCSGFETQSITGKIHLALGDIDSLATPHNRSLNIPIYRLYLNNTATNSIQSIVEIFSMSVAAAFFIPRLFTPSYQLHSLVTLDLV
jgi:hypothetical protein